MNRNSFQIVAGWIILLFVSGCEQEKIENYAPELEYIRYGTSFGECLGYCRNQIKITDSTIVFQKDGWDLEGQLPTVTITEPIGEKFRTKLLEQIHFNEFLQLDTVIGCPDCADGGAEWIEISYKNKTHKVIFEYLNEPETVKDYINYLRTYIHTFRIDSAEAVDFDNRTIIDQQGTITNIVCTRGCYQYLIDWNDMLLYDNQINPEFQSNGLEIQFHGVLQYDSTMIYEPAPNDAPVPAFKAKNIRTFGMKIISD